jgi:glutamate--cysteine ligase
MHFVPLAFASPCLPDLSGQPDCPPNRFYAYGVVARLALVAAAIELEETEAAFEETEGARPVRAAGG